MKKIFLLILAVVVLCIAGCSDDVSDISVIIPTEPSTVVTTDAASGSSEAAATETPTIIPTTETTAEPTTDPATEATAIPTTAPIHEHSFRAATCTTPMTCSCGAAEGSANGHAWIAATCSEPKTCSVCGTTSGLTAGHTFSDGKCTSCGKADPSYTSDTMVWIPTKGGTKYHTHAGCSNMEDPEYVSQSEAESRGFTPCKRCH